jgi:hypothetical protein
MYHQPERSLSSFVPAPNNSPELLAESESFRHAGLGRHCLSRRWSRRGGHRQDTSADRACVEQPSEIAIRRRAWSPLDLFGDAVNQITPGEFAIIYLAYHEGARAETANRRLDGFLSRAKDEWYHPASIRIPISFLIRLYPRTIKGGLPDLIESTVPRYAGAYHDGRLAEDFPATVFTASRQDAY